MIQHLIVLSCILNSIAFVIDCSFTYVAALKTLDMPYANLEFLSDSCYFLTKYMDALDAFRGRFLFLVFKAEL